MLKDVPLCALPYTSVLAMETVDVRPAEPQDLQVLRRLFEEFHEFHALGIPERLRRLDEGGYDPSTLLDGLRKILDDDNAEILLVRVAGRPVGLAEVVVRREENEGLRVGRAYGYLQSLVVHEPFRGFGVGARLLEAAERWSKSMGAAEMRLDTWEFAQGPLGFYEKAGYRTLRRTLVREL